MARSRQFLTQIFRSLSELSTLSVETLADIKSEFANLAPREKAEAFILTTFLRGACVALREQLWLHSRHDHEGREPAVREPEFLRLLFSRELAPIAFLEPIFREPTRAGLKSLVTRMDRLLSFLLELIAPLQAAELHEFVKGAMGKTSTLVLFENGLDESFLHSSMDRAFDAMDELLGIVYRGDLDSPPDEVQSERLYLGAGVGVQSSYVTILIALENLGLQPGSHLVDLGSGYGRVGFALGLLYPEVRFTGYEYVGHRARAAQASADRLGLQKNVRFVEQDLAHLDFQIPEADVYYMYDPFSRETYLHVLKQLKKISERRAITVVSNGDAAGWLSDAMSGLQWESIKHLDSGTVGLFRSRPPLSEPALSV